MLEGLFRNTLSPLQWSLLLAIPPAIIALYFLKLKRVPVEVPSTYLWKKSIEDLHVNSFWQRLRKSLLLFLQLLLVALAIFALLRPGWQGARLVGDRFIFLVDNSASMSAADVQGAESRLALSKEKVAALIDQMERGMSAMIIAFADTPQVVQEFTSNRRMLKERLETIEPSARSTDLLGALKLADGLANPEQISLGPGMQDIEVVDPVATTVYLFSDGRFDDVQDFSLGNLNPVYVPVGSPETNNLAVTAFSTRRNPARPDEQEAYVQVTNFSEQALTAVVDVELDGQFLDARTVDAPAGESVGLSFPLADAPPGRLTATIDPAALQTVDDKLAVDNRAYAGLDDQQPGRVLLVTAGDPVLETALTTGRAARVGELEVAPPSVLAAEDHQRAARAGEYDLIIYDDCAPEEMPRAHTFFINKLPPTPAWRGGAPGGASEESEGPPAEPERVSLPAVIDWNRAHPLLAYVELSDLVIYESLVLTPPAGGDVLIEANAGPLMAVAPRESYEDVVLGFPIIFEEDGQTYPGSSWYRRRSFPTFWLNLLDYLVGQSAPGGDNVVAPGEPIEIRPRANVTEIRVRGPEGEEQTLRRALDEPFQYQDTLRPGVYEVLERGVVTQRFAVNLFDRQESDVRLRASSGESAEGGAVEADIESIRIGYIDVAAAAEAAPARKEIWRWLLLAALGVLVFEWYIYNRRVYV